MLWRWVAIAACAAAAVVAQDFAREKEAVLGSALASEYRKHNTVVENPRLAAYVEHLGEKLNANLPAAPFSFRFAIVSETAERDVAVFPGGYIFVSTRAIRTAVAGREFARSLAHAMAHLAAVRPMRVLPAAQTDLSRIPLIYGELCIRFTGESVVPLAFRAESARREAEADALADGAVAALGTNIEAEFRRVQQEVMIAEPGPRSRRVPSLRRASERPDGTVK
jgi:hypothetical protein